MAVFITDNNTANQRQLSGSILLLAFVFFSVFLLSFSCNEAHATKQIQHKDLSGKEFTPSRFADYKENKVRGLK